MPASRWMRSLHEGALGNSSETRIACESVSVLGSRMVLVRFSRWLEEVAVAVLY